DLWVLAKGRLQRLEFRLSRAAGPQIMARWKKPLELGLPLQEQQERGDTGQGSTLYLVTQPGNRPVVLATAVDPEGDENAPAGDTRVRWQRQLGMVCYGEPLELGDEVLATDRAGGLFRFKAGDYKPGKDDRWLAAAKDVGVA